MKMNKLKEKELVKIGAILNSLFATEVLTKEFPAFKKWMSDLPQETINEVIVEESLKVDLSQSISISRDHFLSMYMHTVAMIGVEEFNHRFTGLRLVLLNTCTQDELNAVLMQIEQIKKNFMNF